MLNPSRRIVHSIFCCEIFCIGKKKMPIKFGIFAAKGKKMRIRSDSSLFEAEKEFKSLKNILQRFCVFWTKFWSGSSFTIFIVIVLTGEWTIFYNNYTQHFWRNIDCSPKYSFPLMVKKRYKKNAENTLLFFSYINETFLDHSQELIFLPESGLKALNVWRYLGKCCRYEFFFLSEQWEKGKLQAGIDSLLFDFDKKLTSSFFQRDKRLL